MNATSHSNSTPLPWVVRWLSLLPTGASMLDFAAGAGRHARFGISRSLRVTAADRQTDGLRDLVSSATVVETDLETQPWPFEARAFDAVVVSNFLHRPRLDELAALVAPGGWLIYQTFAQGNEQFGRPRSPDYLLGEGELLDLARRAGLVVAGYQHGQTDQPAVVQSLAAWRAPPDTGRPVVPMLA